MILTPIFWVPKQPQKAVKSLASYTDYDIQEF